ncbi:MAG: hypothetical protein AAFR56_14330, partial [Chloroflexota bacterium]
MAADVVHHPARQTVTVHYSGVVSYEDLQETHAKILDIISIGPVFLIINLRDHMSTAQTAPTHDQATDIVTIAQHPNTLWVIFVIPGKAESQITGFMRQRYDEMGVPEKLRIVETQREAWQVVAATGVS